MPKLGTMYGIRPHLYTMDEYSEQDVELTQRIFLEKERERIQNVLQVFMDEGMILDLRQPNFD